MSFYSDPAFFICVAAAFIPALVLGLLGRASKVYGLVVSVFFLIALFCRDLEGALFFGVFLAVSCACAFGTLALFKRNAEHKLGLYRAPEGFKPRYAESQDQLREWWSAAGARAWSEGPRGDEERGLMDMMLHHGIGWRIDD